MNHRVRQLFQMALAVALFISLVPFGGALAQDSQSKPQDIVDTAVAAGSFNTLVQAVQAAGLVETLKSEGPFTVFAPTDEAFAAVPADTLNALLADPAALKQVLLYHVVPGAVKSTDLSDGMTAPTAQGEDVTFGVSSAGVKVNDANVVAADVMASNGVIHVIDSVILPPSMTAAAPAEAAAEAAPAAAMTEGPAPETMPVTGSETNNLPIFVVVGLTLLVGAGLFVASRRRLA